MVSCQMLSVNESSERNLGAEVLELTEAGERASQICSAGPLLVDNEEVGAKTC